MVQEVLKLDTCAGAGKDTVYLFSGLVECGDCHQSMVRRASSSGKKKRYYLHCSTYKNSEDCTSHLISEEKLYRVVLKALQNEIEQVGQIEKLLQEIEAIPREQRKMKSYAGQVELLDREIDKYSNLRRQVYEDMSAGIVEKEDYLELTRDFTKRIEAAQTSKMEIQRQQEYSDKVIITADDDTLYPEDWIEGLIRNSTEHPNAVCCYRAHKMMIKEGKLLPYKDWIGLSPGEKGPSYDLLPVGVGGVLYPKDYFKGFDFNIDVIRKLCPTTDDLWLKAIGLIKRIPAVKVYANSKEWFTIKSSQNIKLSSVNADNQNLNDISMKNLIEYYKIDINNIVMGDEH